LRQPPNASTTSATDHVNLNRIAFITKQSSMVAMAFAFGQNDLANCAAPGLAAFKLRGAYLDGLPLDSTNEMKLQTWALFGCGVLLVLGMRTKHEDEYQRAAFGHYQPTFIVAFWNVTSLQKRKFPQARLRIGSQWYKSDLLPDA